MTGLVQEGIFSMQTWAGLLTLPPYDPCREAGEVWPEVAAGEVDWKLTEQLIWKGCDSSVKSIWSPATSSEP